MVLPDSSPWLGPMPGTRPFHPHFAELAIIFREANLALQHTRHDELGDRHFMTVGIAERAATRQVFGFQKFVTRKRHLIEFEVGVAGQSPMIRPPTIASAWTISSANRSNGSSSDQTSIRQSVVSCSPSHSARGSDIRPARRTVNFYSSPYTLNALNASPNCGCQRDNGGRSSAMSPAAHRTRRRSSSGVTSSSGHKI